MVATIGVVVFDWSVDRCRIAWLRSGRSRSARQRQQRRDDQQGNESIHAQSLTGQHFHGRL
jgi:hypothetical protein